MFLLFCTNTLCACGDVESELHLLIHCNVHRTVRTALSVSIHEILTRCGLAATLDRLGHVELLRLFSFGVPDESISISVSVLNAVDEFLKSCRRS